MIQEILSFDIKQDIGQLLIIGEKLSKNDIEGCIRSIDKDEKFKVESIIEKLRATYKVVKQATDYLKQSIQSFSVSSDQIMTEEFDIEEINNMIEDFRLKQVTPDKLSKLE